MTAETLSIWDDCGETPLHIAARCGQLCLVPRALLTPALLSLPAQNESASTVLHFIAAANKMDLIPGSCVIPEMWALKRGDGLTLRDILDRAWNLHSEKNKASPWRCLPATQKQKDKLRFFGCTWDEGIIKGQASDAIDECVRLYPDRESYYQNRPATEEQREKLRSLGLDPDEDSYETGEPLTYEEAKDLILEREMEEEMEERVSDEEKERAYFSSEARQMDESLGRLNVYWPGAVREVTPDEFAKVWALAKSRLADKSSQPQPGELIDALQELLPEFGSERPGSSR